MSRDSDDPCDDITGKDLSKWLKGSNEKSGISIIHW